MFRGGGEGSLEEGLLSQFSILGAGGSGGTQVAKIEFFSLFPYEFIYYIYILNFNPLGQSEVLLSQFSIFRGEGGLWWPQVVKSNFFLHFFPINSFLIPIF